MKCGISDSIDNSKELNLSFSTGIRKLPDLLDKFEILDISYCDITEFPENIGDFKKLKEICASNNKIASFPESFENLAELRKLDLFKNKISMLPKVFGKLGNLSIFDISNNLISNIPVTFVNLINLRELYASNNKFSVFPEIITKIKKLEHIVFSKNSIEIIPSSLKLLENTKFIDFSRNQIHSVENCFSKLESLEKIDLSYNQIKSLPSSIVMMNNIRSIDLRNNPLDKWGEGDCLGINELKIKFHDRVLITNDADEFTLINKNDVYRKIKDDQFHWNIDIIRSFIFKYGNDVIVNKNNLPLDLEYLYSEFHLDESTYESMKQYIIKLCDPKNMNHMTDTIVSLLGNIFNDLKEREIVGDVDWIRFSISHIALVIENESIGRQISEMKLIYFILKKMPSNKPSLDIFIECVISVEKEAIFDQIFAPDFEVEYLHNLRYWKYKLKDEIGFHTNGCEIKSICNDIFHGSPGNVIEVFFKKFTINYIVNLLIKHMENLDMLASDITSKIYENTVVKEENDEDEVDTKNDSNQKNNMNVVVDNISETKSYNKDFIELILKNNSIVLEKQEKRRSLWWIFD